jgi:hypothetical protein
MADLKISELTPLAAGCRRDRCRMPVADTQRITGGALVGGVAGGECLHLRPRNRPRDAAGVRKVGGAGYGAGPGGRGPGRCHD